MDTTAFAALFEPLPETYVDFTPLISKYTGFSVQRDYPTDSPFSPARYKDGRPDNVVLLHVILDPSLNDATKLPIRVRASKYSKYLQNHVDYDFVEDDSPTEESVRQSKESRQPIDLMIVDEFFLDTSTNTILDSDGINLSGDDVLDDAYDRHIDSLRALHPDRVALRSRSALISVLAHLDACVRWALKTLFGRELVTTKGFGGFEGYSKEDVRKLATDSIKLFEYLVPRPVAIVFCLVVAASFALFHLFGLSNSYLRKIFENAFLAGIHGILILWCLNELIPNILRRMLNGTIHVRRKLWG